MSARELLLFLSTMAKGFAALGEGVDLHVKDIGKLRALAAAAGAQLKDLGPIQGRGGTWDQLWQLRLEFQDVQFCFLARDIGAGRAPGLSVVQS